MNRPQRRVGANRLYYDPVPLNDEDKRVLMAIEMDLIDVVNIRPGYRFETRYRIGGKSVTQIVQKLIRHGKVRAIRGADNYCYALLT